MLFHEWDAQFHEGRVNENLMVTVQKICLSHLVLGLYKFHEFYRRFRAVIPPEYRDKCKGLVREIEQKGVIDFRKKYVAHIWDKDNQRPLVHPEIMDRL